MIKFDTEFCPVFFIKSSSITLETSSKAGSESLTDLMWCKKTDYDPLYLRKSIRKSIIITT